MAEWFVHWTTKLATRVQSRVAVGLLTGYSVLGGNLVTATSSIGLDWIIGEVMTGTVGVGSAENKLFQPYQVGTSQTTHVK